MRSGKVGNESKIEWASGVNASGVLAIAFGSATIAGSSMVSTLDIIK